MQVGLILFLDIVCPGPQFSSKNIPAPLPEEFLVEFARGEGLAFQRYLKEPNLRASEIPVCPFRAHHLYISPLFLISHFVLTVSDRIIVVILVGKHYLPEIGDQLALFLGITGEDVKLLRKRIYPC